MTRRHELQHHLAQLGEIRKIISSMKSLAMLEMSRLEGFLGQQQRVVDTIEATAADLIDHYPHLRAVGRDEPPFTLLIGSERGFCGDFNEQLYRAAHALEENTPLLVVGEKLAQRLEGDPRAVAFLPAPMVADEIPLQLDRLLQVLHAHTPVDIPLQLTALCFSSDGVEPRQVTLLPPFSDLPLREPVDAYPPVINLGAGQLFAELVDHYLFALLYALFYGSMTAENRRRVQHLDGAVQRIDDRLERLRRRGDVLRQEEITEEIEVLLLGVDRTVPGHYRVKRSPG